MIEVCMCGHTIEEHGHDPAYPGSSACTECECVAYEADEEFNKQHDSTPANGNMHRAKVDRLLDLLYRATANGTHREVAEGIATDWWPVITINKDGKALIELSSHRIGEPRFKLQYNKLTRKIDRVSLVTGLVADSFDPPEECYC